MKNLKVLFMTVAVCSAIVFSHCNSYAFPYETKLFPFRLLKNNEISFSKINTDEQYKNSTIETNNRIDEQDRNNLRSNEELFPNTKKSSGMSKYLRTTIETSVILGLTSLHYWGTKSSEADFDYDVSFETLKKKFSGKAILFDDNSIGTNSIPGHALAGAYYYLIARSNKLSRAESFLWSFITSAVYEFFIELPEVASINDFVVTPIAGANIGEAMYEFGRYFRCSDNKDDLMYKILAVVADPVSFVNGFIWNDVHYTYSDSEICHYISVQKSFSVFSGMSVSYHENTSNSNIGFTFGFHGKLYFIPQYDKKQTSRSLLKIVS